MKAGYRRFGTTADVGVVSFGSDMKDAFERQAQGMFSIMADPRHVRLRQKYAVEAVGPDPEGLLAAFLEELLFIFDVKGVLLRRFDITSQDDTHLTAEAYGEEIDQSRHVMKTPIKAVTYHMIEVKQTPDGVRTRVVYDI